MAVILEANYSKKVGLPNFSSHQYSVTLRTEISDLSQLERANTELYAKLQASVDSQIQHVGLLPSESSGKPVFATSSSPNPATTHDWKCSDKQRDLILKMIGEHRLNTADIDSLAMERFGAGLRQLNKVQASGLIDELLETHGKTSRTPSRPAYTGRNGR